MYCSSFPERDNLSCPSSSHHSRAISRAASPSLRTYGTFATIQRSLAAGQDELPPLSTLKPENHENSISVSSTTPPLHTLAEAASMASSGQSISDSLSEWYLQPNDQLSPQALELASGWADGTFDLASAQARFDWAGVNFGSDPTGDWMQPITDSNWLPM